MPRAVRIVLAAVSLVFGGFLFLIAGLIVWAFTIGPPERSYLANVPPSIVIEAANRTPIGWRGQLRLPDIGLDAFPPTLINAVLAIEDRRFRTHWGVDVRAVARAMMHNVAAGQIVEGGSTITQQLVKLLYLDDRRTLGRKAFEAAMALRLELTMGKEKILARYLNSVFMGVGAVGIPSAAKLYFDKPVSDLSLPEAAMLAGLIRAPSQLNPLRNLAGARMRAAMVLDAMVANGTLDRTAAERAKAEPAEPRRGQTPVPEGSWFADWVAEEASGYAQPGEGLRVRTTLLPDIQVLAERTVNDALARWGPGSGISQAALVALRPDGAVVAMVGGHDYRASQFNRAVQAKRQPGSAFKLFVYLAALRAGYRLDDIIEDAPVMVNGWAPDNYGERYYGLVTLSEAFARSLNTAAVRLALLVGIDKVVEAARDLGVTAGLAPVPSLALGTSELSLLELTGAYAALRAGVMPVRPWAIEGFGADNDADAIRTAGAPPVTGQRGLDHRAEMVGLLQQVVQRGTGRGAAIPGFAAGKTGTSQNYRDAWFIGFNDALVVGVWVGNDNGTPMDRVTGGSLPASIWRTFVTQATPRMEAAPEDQVAREAGQCDVEACSRTYQSFRASDCTYQPYGGGPRRLCPGGDRNAIAGALPSDALPPGAALSPGACDYAACAAAYSSFRPSDCTYQPYGFQPRRFCEKGAPPRTVAELPYVEQNPRRGGMEGVIRRLFGLGLPN